MRYTVTQVRVLSANCSYHREVDEKSDKFTKKERHHRTDDNFFSNLLRSIQHEILDRSPRAPTPPKCVSPRKNNRFEKNPARKSIEKSSALKKKVGGGSTRGVGFPKND